MTIVLPAVKRVRVRDISGDPRGYLVLDIPKALQDVVTKYAEAVHRKHGDYCHVILGTPKRPRTLAQNNAAWGWCGDIAQQLSDQYPGYSLEEVKVRIYEAMKRLAVQEAGWPTILNPVDGSIEPVSQSLVSVEQDAALLSIIQRFADEHGLWLTERIDGKPVRCLGSKPLQDDDSRL